MWACARDRVPLEKTKTTTEQRTTHNSFFCIFFVMKKRIGHDEKTYCFFFSFGCSVSFSSFIKSRRVGTDSSGKEDEKKPILLFQLGWINCAESSVRHLWELIHSFFYMEKVRFLLFKTVINISIFFLTVILNNRMSLFFFPLLSA